MKRIMFHCGVTTCGSCQFKMKTKYLLGLYSCAPFYCTLYREPIYTEKAKRIKECKEAGAVIELVLTNEGKHIGGTVKHENA